jgi:hypothetical protein
MSKQSTYFLLINLLLLLLGCTHSYDEEVDVSHIPLNIKIQSFHKDFFSLNAENFDEKEKELKNKYGDFYTFYVNDIMGGFKHENIERSEKENILLFLSNKGSQSLLDSVNTHYNDLNFLQDELNILFKHIRFYFPHFPLPQPLTVISEFSYGTFTFDTTHLAIALDMYLGQQYPFYTYLDIPRYVQRKMRKEYIARNCADVLYNMYFGDDTYQPGIPLLDAMIHKGKKLYFIEKVLPHLPDSIIIGYSREQEEWCIKSEYAIWQFMNQRDLLYSTSFLEHKRYLADGPTTNGMPSESPGNIGSWVGWQIVRKFMKESRGTVSLPELLTKYDAKSVVAKARYKPK